MAGGYLDGEDLVIERIGTNTNLESYTLNVVPLIKNKDYEKAFDYLSQNPEVKDYLHASDWKEMCEYFAGKLKGLGKIVGNSEVDGQC